VKRDQYFWEFIPLSIIRALPLGRKLAQYFTHFKDGEDFYDYYLDPQQGQTLNRAATKWRSETQDLVQQLNLNGIELHGKRVLDISGGPGFLAQDLSKVCSSVLVTELSHQVTERMTSALAVRAIKFDFNSDDLSSVVAEKFDLVLIRYAINFCDDLGRLACAIKALLVPGGAVYVSFVPPTLGTMIRWQFDEYTYRNLYQPETMARCFLGQGFQERNRMEDGRYWFAKGMKKMLPFALPYLVRNMFSNCDRRLIQRNFVAIFAKPV
jgi:2-polyprenyl-3-methyl-5-hydroxy-6-metoxy-1,4-benzoquinol methylase